MSPRPVQRLLQSFLAISAIAASGCVDAPTTAPRFVAGEDASTAKQTPTTSKILVMKHDPSTGDQFQVFSLGDDGTQVLQVTNFYAGMHPAWAPDGKRILFIGSLNNSIVLDLGSINSDGTGVTFLHLESYCPNWPSALGKDIIFIDGCTGTLYRVHADGTGVTPLLTGVCITQPSPDAQARTVALCRNYDIVLLNVDTGVLTNITNSPSSFEDEPAFSPNGKLILFRRLSNPNEAWVMNADGTNATRLTTDAEFPHWSPDGKRIAFSRRESAFGNFEVFTMAANGTGLTNLTKTINFNEFVTAWMAY
jgi:Tol biopolymer transport system component